jgi:hypothetical protein
MAIDTALMAMLSPHSAIAISCQALMFRCYAITFFDMLPVFIIAAGQPLAIVFAITLSFSPATFSFRQIAAFIAIDADFLSIRFRLR